MADNTLLNQVHIHEESWEGTYPKNFKKFEWFSIFLWGAFICIGLSLGLAALTKAHYPLFSYYIILAAIICFAEWVIIGFCMDMWRCPRCGKRFFDTSKGIPIATLWTPKSLFFFWIPRGVRQRFFPFFQGQAPIFKDLDACDHCDLPEHPKFPTGTDPKRFDSFL